MAVIDVTMDTAGVERGSATLSTQLTAVQDRIKELTSVQNQFNSAGVQTSSTIRGLTKDGQEFTAQLGIMTKAERELAAAGNDVALGLKNIKYKDAKKETDDLAGSTSKLREFADKLAVSFRYFATYKAFNFIADGMKEGVREANKLQIEISKIRTISQGDDQQTQKKFGEDIRGVSDRTGLDVNEIAKAFYDTTSNQAAKGKDTAAFVETAAQLAKVTGSSTVDTVNLLSSRINAFGLNAKDADKIAAQFFLTIDEGRVVASELANTLGRVDVIAANLGIAMEEVNATIAITTQKGFKTSDAITLLTNLMVKLEKPTEATSRFFKSIGAESGEAAIKIAGGLVPLLKLIVEQTKSGILPVSAFFDEIRGRKQFGVFEQALPEIEAFAKKQQDIVKTMTTFGNAIKIIDESPAAKLNIELTKLSNVFKVDFGQEILRLTADFVAWAGGTDQVTRNSAALAEVLKVVTALAVTYGVVATGVTLINFAWAQSYTVIGARARTALAILAPFLIAYAAFEVGMVALKQFDVGNTKAFTFLDVNPNQLRETANAVAELKREYEDFKKAASQKVDPFAEFDVTVKNVSAAYKDLQGIIAKAITINDGAMASAQEKSKQTAEVLKVSFNTWADNLRSRVSEFKKVITEANSEIEKSKKSTLGFKETLDGILFATKLKYANDGDQFGNQKQQLIAQQINELRSRGRKFFESGTPEGAEQGRAAFKEAAKLQADLKDLQVEQDKARLERNGGGVLYVNTNQLLSDQIDLQKEVNQLEDELQAKLKKRAADYKVGVTAESERLDRLTIAFDKYNKINIFNKDGTISKDFKDEKGNFDRSKAEAALSKEENEIRKNLGGTIEERLKVEREFLDRRRAYFKEAQIAQDADELRTEQAKQLGKEDKFKSDLEKLKVDRQKLVGKQDSDFEFFNQFPKTLAAFADLLAKSGQLKENSAETKEIYEALLKARQASTRLEENKINVGGVLQYDPARLEEAAKANKDALDTLERIRDKLGTPDTIDKGKIFGEVKRKDVPLVLQDDQGQSFSVGESKAAIDKATNRLRADGQGLNKNVEEERRLREDFNKSIKDPLDRLKVLFPELAKAGVQFTDQLNQGLKKNDDNLDNLIKKLERVQELMKAAPPQVGALGNPASDSAASALTDTIGEVYAASGGIAGLFPGQPRGQDIYPIWAARGEMIINSRSAALYKPMLEAIQSRRMPQYMAGGGRVGGDTTVGDITVNVNGGNTEGQNIRNVGKGIERGIRRGTIRLNPKR